MLDYCKNNILMTSRFKSVRIVWTMWQRLFRENAVVSEVYIGLFAGRRWSVRMKWLAHAPQKNSLLGSDWQALCISSSSQGSTPDIQSHLWLSKRVCSCVSLRVQPKCEAVCDLIPGRHWEKMTEFYCPDVEVEKETQANQISKKLAVKKVKETSIVITFAHNYLI